MTTSNRETLVVVNMAELAGHEPPSTTRQAAANAEAAARILREIDAGRYGPERFGSAAWRLADALELVRRLERET